MCTEQYAERVANKKNELVDLTLFSLIPTRYQVLFYLWLIGPVLKHFKVPKYYDQN